MTCESMFDRRAQNTSVCVRCDLVSWPFVYEIGNSIHENFNLQLGMPFITKNYSQTYLAPCKTIKKRKKQNSNYPLSVIIVISYVFYKSYMLINAGRIVLKRWECYSLYLTVFNFTWENVWWWQSLIWTDWSEGWLLNKY